MQSFIGSAVPADAPVSGITLQFLAWVQARPRTYAETMDAWRTSCPRLSAWEDATGAGLVVVAATARGAYGGAAVQLTPLGTATLNAAAP